VGALVTSILSGGATGLLGLVIQRWFDFRNRAQDLELVRINHEQAVVAHLMFYWAQQLAMQHGQQLSADPVHQLVLQIVGTLLYLATPAVVWWFGSRPPARPSK
jgi:hypothetical protein